MLGAALGRDVRGIPGLLGSIEIIKIRIHMQDLNSRDHAGSNAELEVKHFTCFVSDNRNAIVNSFTIKT